LSVLSGMYGRAARFRRAWYGRHPERVRRLTRPVISLGNLVVNVLPSSAAATAAAARWTAWWW
jgi:hypothetical protein